MGGRIVVINPNSSQAVTDGIDRALEPLRSPSGPVIECMTLADGPPGIETERDVESVVMPLCRIIETRDNQSDAFVIACFSDPGLHAARETTAKPVFGIAESGVLHALALGERFGIIAILEGSIPRHRRYLGAMGILSRLAGECAVGLGVAELEDEPQVGDRMLETGRILKDVHGADVLVLGCAGMAGYRSSLETALGIPVVDPTQAATGMAVTAVRLAAAPGA